MYCGKFRSIFFRQWVYARFPPPPETSSSGIPPSSLYCVQKSTSRASPAARNRKMAASPAVRLLLDCANAFVPCTSKPVPTVAPAAVSPVFRKLRRFPLLIGVVFSFISILFHNCPNCATGLLLHFRREMLEHLLHVFVKTLNVLIGFVR